jgi:hypothetical protein
MPKKPIDYSNCCIYKIEHIENESLIYVGHTTNFKQRKAEHKNTCNNENNKSFNLKLYTMIRLNGGWEMFVMIEVEKYPCNDKREAEKRENEVMKESKASMNMIKSYITAEEKLEQHRQYNKDNKEKIKQYNKDNKEKMKQYYEKNKDKFKQYKNEYAEKNKENIAKREKEYYENNKNNSLII